jgi:4-hydroxy-tetrahydrodipicolinate reductase
MLAAAGAEASMKIGVLGGAGRMGRAVIAEVLAGGATLAGAVEPAGHPAHGHDLGALVGAEPVGVALTADAAALIAAADVVIEFSAPAATAAHVALAAAHGTAHVIGTTGLSAAQEQAIREAAGRTAIVRAANMSLGINLLLGLSEQVARALGPEAFDIEILELHHKHKVDAPSGTALALGEAAARGRGVDLAAVAARGRDGLTGARKTGAIGFAALRGGDAVGDHVVTFAGAGERLELVHRATDRRIYARGALTAARWLHGRSPGLYGMADVLGLTGASP